MELIVIFITLVVLWQYFENRSYKAHLKRLQQRVIELTQRVIALEKQQDPTLSKSTVQPSVSQPLVTPDAVSVKPSGEQPNELSNALRHEMPQTPPTTSQPVAQPVTAITDRQPSLASPTIWEGNKTSANDNTPTDTAYQSSWQRSDHSQPPTDDVALNPTHSVSEQPTIPAKPTFWDNATATAKAWITTGNIPVKIGMLVLIAAVIAFLRYATHQGWFRLPIEYKLLGIAATAVGALGFAWHKRHVKRSFSLSVQGGSIGILLLVIFSAVKMYGVLSPAVGFILSVGAVLTAAVLAVQQDAKALAVMAIFAGFLAPIGLSDGSGNHIVLFTYYAILNVGIFVIAWLKPWRELNLLGFVFTYVIGSTWGGLRYEAVHFATTEPFVILFFLFYLCIPLRYAQRAEQGNRRYHQKIDSALLFGTPLVTLGLQVGLLHDDSTRLALSCLIMGLFYAFLAWWLRGKPAYETLQKAYIGLAVGLITLSVPIGLSAKATTAIFALEGAGALWLGTREKRQLTWVFGALLQVAAAAGFFFVYQSVNTFSRAVINDYYLNTLLIAVSAWFAAWVCYHNGQSANQRGGKTTNTANTVFTKQNLTWAARGFFVWGMAWWLVWGVHEIGQYAPKSRQTEDILVLFSISALGLVFAHRYYRDSWLVGTICALFISGVKALTLSAGLFDNYHHLSGYELTTWVLYAGVGLLAWRQLRDVVHVGINIALTVWSISLAVVLSAVVQQILPIAQTNTGMYWWVNSIVWLLLMGILNGLPHVVTWVGQRHSDPRWQRYLGSVTAVILTLCFARLTALPGEFGTLWLPMLNRIEALQIIIVGLLCWWLIQQKVKTVLLNIGAYLAAISLVLTITARMFYHWVGSNVDDIITNLNQWGDWYYLAMGSFWIGVALLLCRVLPKYLTHVVGGWTAVSHAFFYSITILLAVAWCGLLTLPGNASPLMWIPVLNPLAVLQWSILGLLWLTMRQHSAWFTVSRRSLIVPLLIGLLISVMTLRVVHHSADLTWGLSLFQTAIAQMALTVVWSILGVVSWIVGSKRCSRPIWLLGAVLMSVVLVKLVLIDRGHLGNLFGILSFFAYGMLCVVVGYFAPVPPSDKTEPKVSL